MMFQQYITGLENNKILFHVPIGSAKKSYLIGFHQNPPAIKYVQHEKKYLYSVA